MLKINEKNLVETLLECHPSYPVVPKGWEVSSRGTPFLLPAGMGGISLNVGAGHTAFGWAGDHVEPGVSCRAVIEENGHTSSHNRALQTLACVGNEATLISGKAKGKKGYVLGHHGGIENLVVEFPEKVKRQMAYADKIQIRGCGQGMRLLDFPDIHLFNLSPFLLKRMRIKPSRDGKKLEVPVTTLVPPECMGSGLGVSHVATGDYDVMTSDPDTVKRYKLDKMRFGDFIAIQDHDNRYGISFRRGALSIGIVIHSDSMLAGHGPGITVLMTCDRPLLVPKISSQANIGFYLKG